MMKRQYVFLREKDEGGNLGQPMALSDEQFTQLLDKVGERASEAAQKALEEAGAGKPARGPAGAPDGGDRGSERPAAPEISNEARAYGQAWRSRPGWEQEYRNSANPTVRAAIEAGRTPEIDHYISEWIAAVDAKNDGAARAACEKANALYYSGPKGGARAPLATSPTAQGGALVPVPLSSQIVIIRTKIERIAPRSMPFPTDNTSIRVPTEATLMAPAGVAENANMVDTDPTFGEITLTKKKHYVKPRSSRELVEDSPFGLANLLASQAGRQFAVYRDTQACTGDGVGTNWTDGLFNNSSIGTTPTLGALDYPKMVGLFWSLASEWRDGLNPAWMANAEVLQQINLIVDTANRPIFLGQGERPTQVSDVGTGVVGTIFGRPVLEVPAPGTGTGNNGQILFGDLSGFGVIPAGTMTAEATTEGDGAFAADQIVWKFRERMDGAVMQASAFHKGTGITLP